MPTPKHRWWILRLQCPVRRSSWHSAKVQEVDFKGQLSNIVSDLLAVLNLPEWPAAGIVLLSLSAQLLSCRGIGCPEIKIREFALDILGQIAAKVRVDGVACERDNLLQSLTNAKMNGEQGTEVSKSTSDALELACQDACFPHSSCSSRVQHSQIFLLTLICLFLNVCISGTFVKLLCRKQYLTEWNSCLWHFHWHSLQESTV